MRWHINMPYTTKNFDHCMWSLNICSDKKKYMHATGWLPTALFCWLFFNGWFFLYFVPFHFSFSLFIRILCDVALKGCEWQITYFKISECYSTHQRNSSSDEIIYSIGFFQLFTVCRHFAAISLKLNMKTSSKQ